LQVQVETGTKCSYHVATQGHADGEVVNPVVGVRELKNQASRIVRAIREEGAQYVITVDGRPVAVLRPFTPDDAEDLNRAKADHFLSVLDAYSERISAAWTSPLTAAEAVDEQRRNP
jgi:prevent-host-death family protein